MIDILNFSSQFSPLQPPSRVWWPLPPTPDLSSQELNVQGAMGNWTRFRCHVLWHWLARKLWCEVPHTALSNFHPGLILFSFEVCEVKSEEFALFNFDFMGEVMTRRIRFREVERRQNSTPFSILLGPDHSPFEPPTRFRTMFKSSEPNFNHVCLAEEFWMPIHQIHLFRAGVQGFERSAKLSFITDSDFVINVTLKVGETYPDGVALGNLDFLDKFVVVRISVRVVRRGQDRVAKCQLFYTEQNPWTKFYTKKSA